MDFAKVVFEVIVEVPPSSLSPLKPPAAANPKFKILNPKK